MYKEDIYFYNIIHLRIFITFTYIFIPLLFSMCVDVYINKIIIVINYIYITR